MVRVSRTASFNSELEAGDTAIIKEVYDSENAQEIFQIELERALQVGCRTIIIEPSKLAEETSQWIATGSHLHKLTIISGLGAIATGLYFWDKPFAPFPLGLTSAMCATLYLTAWQFDPCIKYRVGQNLKKANLSSKTKSSGPMVLVRKEKQTAQVVFHSSLAIFAFSFCLWRVWSDG